MQRRDAGVGHVRDFLKRVALDLMQHEHDALLRRELGERAVGHALSLEARIGALPRAFRATEPHPLLESGPASAAMTCACMIEGAPRRDADEPRREARAAIEALGAVDGGEEGVLHHVVHLGVVRPEDTTGSTEHGVHVLSVEPTHGVVIACGGAEEPLALEHTRLRFGGGSALSGSLEDGHAHGLFRGSLGGPRISRGPYESRRRPDSPRFPRGREGVDAPRAGGQHPAMTPSIPSRATLSSLGLGLLTLLGCSSTSGSSASGTSSSGGESQTRAPMELDAAVAASNRFTAELYRTIAQPHANGAASPYSVAVAFGMTREGARGETRSELDAALHLEGDTTRANAALAERLATIGASGVELRTANRVFLEETQSVEPTFEASMRDGFRAPFERVGFIADPESSRVRVNDWVASQTNDRIRDLLPPASIDGDTRLVLTNAVYFHGTWQTSFDRARTQDLGFFVDGTTPANVPMMQAERAMRFGHAEGAAVGELPYTGGEISMIVVVPDAQDGLPALLSDLDGDRTQRWIDSLTERPNVILKLPRFRVAPSESLALSEPMRSLGVRLAFQSGDADLTGIATTHPPLFVAEGYHRAFVEVNEEGTEAAAATAVVISTRSAPTRPPQRDELIADRPFLFFLRDTRTGAILFVGHVVDPR